MKILASTETTGSVFRLRTWVAHRISLKDHAGGMWQLQEKDEDGDWVDVSGMTWDDSKVLLLYGATQREYRLTGGTAGASAHATCIDGRDVELVS